jgi:hypothetical protein
MSRPSVESTLFRARRRLSEEYEELVSGERCRRIQAIIAGATDGRAGARDERKMARHVSYCQPCRRAAFAAGFDADALTPKRTAREKIAALLPLPAFLKRRIAGHGAEESAATSAGGHAATLAQLSTAAASYADPAMQWGKAVTKAAAVAAAVVGAGVAAHDTGLIGATPRDERPAAISSPSRDAAGALTTRPAASGSSIATGSAGGSSPSSKPSSGGPSAGSGSGSSSAAGSGGGSQSPSTPLGADPVNAAKSKLPSGAQDDPLTKTVKHLTNPDSGGAPVKAPEVPKVEVPKVELPKLPDAPASVPDPGGVVSGATGAVNDATGAATGAVNGATGAAGGVVNGTTGAVGGVVGAAGGAVSGTVGGVTGGGGGILGGG